jgi:hypothetical protein
LKPFSCVRHRCFPANTGESWGTLLASGDDLKSKAKLESKAPGCAKVCFAANNGLKLGTCKLQRSKAALESTSSECGKFGFTASTELKLEIKKPREPKSQLETISWRRLVSKAELESKLVCVRQAWFHCRHRAKVGSQETPGDHLKSKVQLESISWRRFEI